MYASALVLKLIADIIDYYAYVKKTRKAIGYSKEDAQDLKLHHKCMAVVVGFIFYVYVVKNKKS
jgi:hypothetical protein